MDMNSLQQTSRPSFPRTHSLCRTPLLVPWARGWATLASTARMRFPLAPHTPAPLRTSLPLIHLVIAAKFHPPLQHRLPPHCPSQLSAAHNLLITLHPSASVSGPVLSPVHSDFLFEAPSFPHLLSSHSLHHCTSGLYEPSSSTPLGGASVSLPALSHAPGSAGLSCASFLAEVRLGSHLGCVEC